MPHINKRLVRGTLPAHLTKSFVRLQHHQLIGTAGHYCPDHSEGDALMALQADPLDVLPSRLRGASGHG